MNQITIKETNKNILKAIAFSNKNKYSFIKINESEVHERFNQILLDFPTDDDRFSELEEEGIKKSILDLLFDDFSYDYFFSEETKDHFFIHYSASFILEPDYHDDDYLECNPYFEYLSEYKENDQKSPDFKYIKEFLVVQNNAMSESFDKSIIESFKNETYIDLDISFLEIYLEMYPNSKYSTYEHDGDTYLRIEEKSNAIEFLDKLNLDGLNKIRSILN